MRKLTILIAIILIVGLLAGCGGWVTPAPKLDYIEVEPDEVTLITNSYTGSTEQLEVTAYYVVCGANDVTSDCEYVSSNTEIVTVSDKGLVVGKIPEFLPPGSDFTEATILVTYTQHNAWTGMIVRTTEVDVTVKY